MDSLCFYQPRPERLLNVEVSIYLMPSEASEAT